MYGVRQPTMKEKGVLVLNWINGLHKASLFNSVPVDKRQGENLRVKVCAAHQEGDGCASVELDKRTAQGKFIQFSTSSKESRRKSA